MKLLRGAVQRLRWHHGPLSYVLVTGRKQSGGGHVDAGGSGSELSNKAPPFRPSSFPHCLGDGDESLNPSGTHTINKATSRFNANIYTAPMKCQAHARCGVLAGSL